MTHPFFTDDKMLFLALLFAFVMGAIGAVLVVWRDWDVVWVVALELFNVLALAYYYSLWSAAVSPLTAFPEVNLLIRPYNALLWLLIVSYALTRLNAKRHARERWKE